MLLCMFEKSISLTPNFENCHNASNYVCGIGTSFYYEVMSVRENENVFTMS